jgi:integrase
MASLYKKPVSVTDAKTGQRIKRKSKKWWGRYRDENGVERRVPLAVDKAAAQAMLNELVRKVERRAAGLDDRFEEHRRTPLADHLADFRQFLEGKGNTEKHARQTCTRVQAITSGCRFVRLGDVNPSAVVEWLKNERAAERIGIQSSNYYLACIKSFLAWMVKDGRTDRNPLAHISGMNAKVDVRRQRRSLPPDQFAMFLQAARTGKPKRKLSGQDRAMLYLLAANSGFRCSELASLTPESFDLTPDSPSVTVGAAYSKRRRQDTQPLPRDFATLLRQWLRGKPAKQCVWPGRWLNHAAKMVKADLGAARAAWIRNASTPQEAKEREGSTFLAFRDEVGRVFDFHSLRHQYVSNLAAAGVHPKIAQTLARHSTIALTLDRYTHVGLYDLSVSVNSLPAIPVEAPNAQAKLLMATGTEDDGARSEVPTVVPRGAENGAVLPASATLRFAPDCTQSRGETRESNALTPRPGKTIRTDPRESTPACINGNGKGPSRIRTGAGGFAIRCLTAWLRGRRRGDPSGRAEACQREPSHFARFAILYIPSPNKKCLASRRRWAMISFTFHARTGRQARKRKPGATWAFEAVWMFCEGKGSRPCAVCRSVW